MSSAAPASPRTRVRRLPQRAAYDRETVHAILDAGLICHVGFAIDGQPIVLPTIHTRIDDTLYVHGAPANRMLRTLDGGVDACVTVTLVDGLVLARSAFHHSMNYRSVVVMGRARRVDDADEKQAALLALVEQVMPGRSRDARGPNEKELVGTLVLAIPIDEASAKVRMGPPNDDEEDLASVDAWAGVVPLSVVAGAPVPDPKLRTGIDVPDYVRDYVPEEARS